ncbi:amino acid permease, partial [Actinoplanes sp. NPDC051633]|uniref:amino acid permease n=1 Tax=Actinoplanes sp. NPDC051633 TaxID=3155670 RepID=UPI003425DA39
MPTKQSGSVWRRLPVDRIEEIEESSGVGRLTKSLGLWQLTAIGVGGIIGVGIFSLAGLVAHGDEDNPGVGPAVLVAFLIAGLASAAAALSYAEFAGMIPRAGSAYTYGYVALGELIGWFIGWDLLLEYVAIVAVVAIGISGYLDSFLDGFGVNLPDSITASAEEGGVVNLPAMLICLLVTFILSRGARTFGRFELIAVAIKIVLILFIVGLGIFYINTGNYNPFMPSGFGPALTGAATVFFA